MTTLASQNKANPAIKVVIPDPAFGQAALLCLPLAEPEF